MPKIKHTIAQGFGKGELYDMLIAVRADLNAIRTAFLAHRHSAAGGTGTGTGPSTEAEAAGTTASTITLTVE